MKETNNSTIRDIFIIAFNTGLRLSEITKLKWPNINLIKEIITVGDEEFTTKNSKQRLIPIANEVKIILLKIRKKSYIKNGFIFSKPNGFCYNSDYVSSSFKKACRRANIKENIHFHSLRYSFASNLANKGVPLIAIKELLGHSDISTTQIYSHTNLENLRNAIQKLNAAYKKTFDEQIAEHLGKKNHLLEEIKRILLIYNQLLLMLSPATYFCKPSIRRSKYISGNY